MGPFRFIHFSIFFFSLTHAIDGFGWSVHVQEILLSSNPDHKMMTPDVAAQWSIKHTCTILMISFLAHLILHRPSYDPSHRSWLFSRLASAFDSWSQSLILTLCHLRNGFIKRWSVNSIIVIIIIISWKFNDKCFLWEKFKFPLVVRNLKRRTYQWQIKKSL